MTLPRTTERIRKHYDLACWLALFHSRGIGSARYRRLIDAYGDPVNVIAAAEQQSPPGQPLDDMPEPPDWQAVDRDLAWLDSHDNHHIVNWHDARYPAMLNEISDPPPVLYVRGNVSLLQTPQLAIVGSRNPTIAGQRLSKEFARQLAALGLTITSGLALGIDAAAHHGALAATGRTIAVLGCGLDNIYPRRHQGLAKEILAHGTLVSELPPDTAPLPAHFPRRNRIISGLSVGTLVTEAALRSGSLITARLALEQGREVFAVPGSIQNPLARGCHLLIRQGAKLVEQLNDILEEIGPLWAASLAAESTRREQEDEHSRLDPDHRKVIQTIGFDPTPIDVLATRTGMTVETLSSILLSLELEGQITSLPGGHYLRLGNKELT